MLGIQHSPPLTENQVRVNILLAYSRLLGEGDKATAHLLPRGGRLATSKAPSVTQQPASGSHRKVPQIHNKSEPSASVCDLFDVERSTRSTTAISRGVSSARHCLVSNKRLRQTITVVPAEKLLAEGETHPSLQPATQDLPTTKLSPGAPVEEAWPVAEAWEDFNEDEQYDVNAQWKQRADVTTETAAGADSAAALSVDEPGSGIGSGMDGAENAAFVSDGDDIDAGDDDDDAAAPEPSSTVDPADDDDAAAPEPSSTVDPADDDEEWENAFAEEGLMADDASVDLGDQEQPADNAEDNAVSGGFAALLGDDDHDDDAEHGGYHDEYHDGDDEDETGDGVEVF